MITRSKPKPHEAAAEVAPIAAMDPDSTRDRDWPGYAHRLADGRAWTIPRPRPRVRPVVVEANPAVPGSQDGVDFVVRFGYPWGADRAVRRLKETVLESPPDDPPPYASILAAAFGLLRLAHRIPRELAADLLDLDRDECYRLGVAILSIEAGLSDEAVDGRIRAIGTADPAEGPAGDVAGEGAEEPTAATSARSVVEDLETIFLPVQVS